MGEPCPRGSHLESHRLEDLPTEEAEAVGPYPAYSSYDSNRGWHGEWFYIRNPTEVPFPMFTGERLKRRESWSWGPAGRQNKLEIIETELRRLVQHGLDGLRVFHTFFHCRVTPLVETRRPMWEYSGPMYPDRASPEELPKDEVWS